MASPVFLGLAGCTISPTGTTDIVPLSTTTTPLPVLSADLELGDEHVHSYTVDWQIASTPVAEGLPLTLRWDGLVTDAYSVQRDADSFDVLVLLRVVGTANDAKDWLATDQLEAHVTGQWTADAQGKTELRTTALSPAFDAAELTEDAGTVWLWALGDRAGARLDLRVGLLLTPSAAQPGTIVALPNGATRITVDARIDGESLRTTGGLDAYTLDWSGVTLDGYGAPFDPQHVDEVFVGRFEGPGIDEADDLGSVLWDLEAAATEFLTMPLTGQTAVSLQDLGFDGFEKGNVYLVGTRCSTCFGPAPAFAVGVAVR